MLALCLMLLVTYYAFNYAGIINWPGPNCVCMNKNKFDWICEKGPCTHNYIYLEKAILKYSILGYISRMHAAACVCFSLIYNHQRPFSGWTLQWIAS